MEHKVFEFSPPESVRVYNFPGGDRVCFENVVKVTIGYSGVHYVEYVDGWSNEVWKTIVNTGWISLEVSGNQNWVDEDCGCDCGECGCCSEHIDHGRPSDGEEDYLRILKWMKNHGIL